MQVNPADPTSIFHLSGYSSQNRYDAGTAFKLASEHLMVWL